MNIMIGTIGVRMAVTKNIFQDVQSAFSIRKRIKDCFSISRKLLREQRHRIHDNVKALSLSRLCVNSNKKLKPFTLCYGAVFVSLSVPYNFSTLLKALLDVKSRPLSFSVSKCESPTSPHNNDKESHAFPEWAFTVCDNSCDQNSIIKATRLCLRAARLLCVFVPLLLLYPLTCLGENIFTLWLRLVYHSVENSGATFVKLGQWASTRRDLFSPEFCDCFSRLHHRVKPHSWAHTARLLEEAYGPYWQSLLSLKDGQEPIGSGCIAQVYRGFLRADVVTKELLQSTGTVNADVNKAIFGEGVEIVTFQSSGDASSLDDIALYTNKEVQGIHVAIKVLHPEIRETFHRDLLLMKWTAKTLTYFFPNLHWVNLVQCVEEFSITMDKQLNMFHEARCLQRFGSDFRHVPEITVPKPIVPLLRGNVLVETFEEGVSIGSIVSDPSQPRDLKEELARIGISAMLKMVFENNFVHADMHPGNLLVQKLEHFKTEKTSVIQVDTLDMMMVDVRPSTEPAVKLVLLDCGITASLDDDAKDKFLKVFTAVVKGDGEAVADLFLKRSAVNHCTNTEQFKTEMAEIVLKGRKNLISISKIKVAELMQEVLNVLSRHKIQLESTFATVILAIAMLEGLGRSLDPNLDLLEKARPVLLGGGGS